MEMPPIDSSIGGLSTWEFSFLRWSAGVPARQFFGQVARLISLLRPSPEDVVVGKYNLSWRGLSAELTPINEPSALLANF